MEYYVKVITQLWFFAFSTIGLFAIMTLLIEGKKEANKVYTFLGLISKCYFLFRCVTYFFV